MPAWIRSFQTAFSAVNSNDNPNRQGSTFSFASGPSGNIEVHKCGVVLWSVASVCVCLRFQQLDLLTSSSQVKIHHVTIKSEYKGERKPNWNLSKQQTQQADNKFTRCRSSLTQQKRKPHRLSQLRSFMRINFLHRQHTTTTVINSGGPKMWNLSPFAFNFVRT